MLAPLSAHPVTASDEKVKFSTADALHVSAYTHLIVYRQEVRSNLEKSVAADEHHTAALKLH